MENFITWVQASYRENPFLWNLAFFGVGCMILGIWIRGKLTKKPKKKD